MCQLLIEAIEETRIKEPFKLIAYVIMPDHAHFFLNPLNLDIRKTIGRIKGRSAHSILTFLKERGYTSSLEKLRLKEERSSRQTYSVWQKGFSSIDIWSEKFAIQKTGYIHANPVRAGLCDHSAKWKWSSYAAYFPHEAGSIPIQVDKQAFWEFEDVDMKMWIYNFATHKCVS